MEQKNLQPFISVIHDFIYDNEAESMKDFARDKLRRSMHLSRYSKLRINLEDVVEILVLILLGKVSLTAPVSSEPVLRPGSMKVMMKASHCIKLHSKSALESKELLSFRPCGIMDQSPSRFDIGLDVFFKKYINFVVNF